MMRLSAFYACGRLDINLTSKFADSFLLGLLDLFACPVRKAGSLVSYFYLDTQFFQLPLFFCVLLDLFSVACRA